MKKITAMLCVLALVAGCADKNIKTSDGKMATKLDESPDVICHDNVKYVKFGFAQSSWGGVQMGNDNKPLTCDKNDDASVDEGCYNGVVYVKFGFAQSAWGGTKYNKDGTVVMCGAGINNAEVSQPTSSVK